MKTRRGSSLVGLALGAAALMSLGNAAYAAEKRVIDGSEYCVLSVDEAMSTSPGRTVVSHDNKDFNGDGIPDLMVAFNVKQFRKSDRTETRLYQGMIDKDESYKVRKKLDPERNKVIEWRGGSNEKYWAEKIDGRWYPLSERETVEHKMPSEEDIEAALNRYKKTLDGPNDYRAYLRLKERREEALKQLKDM